MEDENLEEQQTESPREIVERHKANDAIRMPKSQTQSPKNQQQTNKNNNLDQNAKKSAIKTGVTTAARAAGVPSIVSEAAMTTEEGKATLNEAAQEPTVTSGIAYVVSKLVTKTWLWIVILGAAIFLFVFLIIVIFLLKNTDNLNYAAGNFFANEDYKKLYSEVESVVTEYQNKYGVTVDKYLIIATLTAFQDNEMYFDKTTSNAYEYTTVDDEETDENGNTITISKTVDEMTAKIEILAKYQIMTNTTCSADSSNMRKIASNDDSTNILNFWTSAANKEKNYNCDGSSGKSYELSIEEGLIDEEDSGSTFYWNLIDEDFLKEYYPEYFKGIGDKKIYESHAAQVVEYIYLYAKSLQELDCNNDNNSGGELNSNFTTINVDCPGITVLPDSEGKYGGTYQLEEYVAGVIQHEFTPSYMNNIGGNNKTAIQENLKAFAIAIRSYSISRTNGCSKSIRNSSADQNFVPTDDAIIWNAVNETAGIVLTNNNSVISAEYDSFKGKNNCNGEVCSYNYRKIPGTSTHNVTIPNSWNHFAAGGHGRGMSQLAALDLAVNQNKNYQEIVKYFYDDNVQIQRLSGTTSSGGNNSTTAYCQRTGPTGNGNGTCDGKTIYKGKKIGAKSLKSPMTLLSCTADQAEKAFNEIADACGKISHAGSLRSLSASVNESRSSTSFHYTGRAFDLDTTQGMQSKDTYFYVTKEDTSGNDNSHYYRLYCRVNGNSSSSYIKDTSIIPVYYDHGKILQKTAISGKFLDVTSVFNSYGIYGIGPRSCYTRNYLCTEWWHFQDTSGLVKGTTTFRQALDQLFGQGYNYANTPVYSHLNKKWTGGSFN